MNCLVMVDPSRVPGRHNVFLSGDDAEAKSAAAEILRSFGWPDEAILDLGDIATARGPEMLLALWLRVRLASGTSDFNLAVVR